MNVNIRNADAVNAGLPRETRHRSDLFGRKGRSYLMHDDTLPDNSKDLNHA